MEGIVNKVASSSLITLDLEEHLPKPGQVYKLDIVHGLYEGLILREKEFRAWVSLQTKEILEPFVFISCSSDGILPNWAFMLVSSALIKSGKQVYLGDNNTCLESFMLDSVKTDFLEKLKGDKIVVKGCAKVEISQTFYGEISKLLIPYSSSIMFGEPCSTVPIYKAQKKPLE